MARKRRDCLRADKSDLYGEGGLLPYPSSLPRHPLHLSARAEEFYGLEYTWVLGSENRPIWPPSQANRGGRSTRPKGLGLRVIDPGCVHRGDVLPAGGRGVEDASGRLSAVRETELRISLPRPRLEEGLLR